MFWTDFPTTTFAESTGTALGGACYVGLLAAVSFSDVRSRRISNRLVLALAVLGVAFSIATVSPGTGIVRALLGFALGFALWLPFHAIGMIGAGDVKLFAAASCWLAPSQVLSAALFSALAGGLLSIAALVLAHGFGITTLRLAEVIRDPTVVRSPLAVPAESRTLPYGLALTIGLGIAGFSAPLAHLWYRFV